MANLRVLDEGLRVQDSCIEFNFVGAGVTVTRPSANDRVTVTIPSAADVGGWTRDVVPTTVRLTNVNDAVAIGAALAAGAEKVFINPTGGGPALRLGGAQVMPKTGTAAAAATQAASQLFRLIASMWTGAAEAERDFDLFAGPSTLGADEAGVARAQLDLFYEGFRLLAIRTRTAAPADAPGVAFINDNPAGGDEAFNFVATANYAVGDTVFGIDDGGGTLFQVRGTGLVNSIAGFMVNGTQVVGAQGALIADAVGGTEIATINAILARMRAHGLIAT